MDEQGFRYQVVSIDGDLVFVVGKGRGRIRVSSFVFKESSSYFAKLLGPDFKEGRLLEANTEADSLPRIMFPEDNFDAFWLAADIIHGTMHEATNPSAGELEELAFLLHQYDLNDAVRPTVLGWLNAPIVECTQNLPQIQEDKHTSKLVETARLSYWLHEPSAFHDATKEIIKQTSAPLFKHMNTLDDDKVLRDCLTLKLEQVRGAAFAKIYNKLIHGLFNYFARTAPHEIPYAISNVHSLAVHEPEKKSIWSLRTHSLTLLFPSGSQEEPESTPPIQWCHFCHRAGDEVDMEHNPHCVAKMLEDQILALDGLCLGCFHDYVETPDSGDKYHHPQACEKLQ